MKKVKFTRAMANVSAMCLTKMDDHMPRRTFATLRFLGEDLDPEVISGLLGIAPTTSYRKGDAYEAGRSRHAQVRKFGMWLFDTEPSTKSPNLSPYVAKIQSLLTDDPSKFWKDDRYAAVKTFVRVNKIQLDVSLFWRGKTDGDVPDVPGEFVEVVKSMGGEVEQDFP